MLYFGDGILDTLSEAAGTEPVVATERGSLYLSPSESVGAARLNGTFTEYQEFLQSLDENLRPRRKWIIPIGGQSFHVLINTPIKVRDGKTYVQGREVVFL